MPNSWRDTLKSGPLSALYLLARNTKRKIRREPLSGTVQTPQAALSAPDLRALAHDLPDHPRLYFSLALAYLDPSYSRALDKTQPQDAASHRRALACLRCAEALGFESAERVAVYRAWIRARLGDAEAAHAMVESLNEWELDSETALLAKIRSGDVEPLGPTDSPADGRWNAVRADLEDNTPEMLVVFGDTDAVTSDWAPNIRYLLVDEDVTGLTPDSALRLNVDFNVCAGPTSHQDSAAAAGIRWRQWYTIAE